MSVSAPQHTTGDDVLRRHPLATATGINLMGALLMGSGAMCPKCCHGTRVTSKRWARCKKCGERVPRRKMEDVAAELRGSAPPRGREAQRGNT